MTDGRTATLVQRAPTEGRVGSTSVKRLSVCLFIAFCLLVCMNGPVFFLSMRVFDRPGPSWEDAVVRGSFRAVGLAGSVIALVSLVAWVRKGPERHRLIEAWTAAPLLAYAVLALWSSRWSVAPALTRSRAGIYLGLALLSMWIATRALEEIRLAVTVSTATAVGASLVLVRFWPEIGRMDDGSWMGLFTNRNSLAPVSALLVLCGVALGLQGSRWIGGAGVLAGALALYGTGNRTSVLAMVAASLLASAVVAVREVANRRGVRMAAGVGIGLLAGGLVGTAVVWSRLADTSTIRTRRLIWQLTFDLIEQRPSRGFGFFALWDDPVLTRIPYERIGKPFGSAHNSGLEAWLGLGRIGLVLVLLIAVLGLAGAFAQLWRRPGREQWFWAALVTFLVIENLTESFVLWFSYNWLMLSTAAVISGRFLREGARRAAAPAQ